KPDLAVLDTRFTSHSVCVLSGNGDGTFTELSKSAVGPYIGILAAGDFNGDHKPDLVVVNPRPVILTNEVLSTVSILLGKGDGTFQQGTAYEVGIHPVSAVVEDFNADGKSDIVVLNGEIFDTTVSVLLGKG